MFEDYTCEVERIDDDKISFIYRHGEFPMDAVGVTITLPDNPDDATPEWVRLEMTLNAGQAFSLWGSLRRAKAHRSNQALLRQRLGNVRMAGQYTLEPEIPGPGQPPII